MVSAFVMTLAARLHDIRLAIEKARQNSPLAGVKTTLLGASKGQTAALIEEAIALGITDFGENRVQEAEGKWPALKEKYPHIRLHLIGSLQTNKAKDALGLFDVIQTVDREKLALALARIRDESAAARTSPACPPKLEERRWEPRPMKFSGENFGGKRMFIQINTGEEPQKAGIIPAEADEFIRFCIHDLKLPVVGLMCVPPADQPPAPHFALLRNIALTHDLKELSMGMSGDYEVAARMGSTCVRVGTALFGERR
jgi:uncharacterized pyridoxal phosphate-containing UPF0001 family protein